MEDIINFLAAIFLIFMCIGFGYIKGYVKACKEESNIPDQYCFRCEIEMPVKEKNGILRCSSCGLYHGKLE